MSTAATRILHMHIEKTGGTALRVALRRAMGGKDVRLLPDTHESKLADVNPDEWDLISGHFGYTKLHALGGRIITLLRDPFDRFVSVYYYWREMHRKGVDQGRKTSLAMNYSLDEFVKIKDDVALIEQYFNRMTWQVGATFLLNGRHPVRAEGVTDDELLRRAIANMNACAVVGIQERMADLAEAVHKRLNVAVSVERLNVTDERIAVDELSFETRRRIAEWVYLDVELYQHARALVAAGGGA
jgi:hypothetical protein